MLQETLVDFDDDENLFCVSSGILQAFALDGIDMIKMSVYRRDDADTVLVRKVDIEGCEGEFIWFQIWQTLNNFYDQNQFWVFDANLLRMNEHLL